jgi:ribulose-phosphate 3-epimerase
VKSLRTTTDLPLDCHLMVIEPERMIDAFAEAGADVITVHEEASPHLHRTLQHIRGLGKKAGVSLNPHTPEESVRYVLPSLDLILVMSVNPGFGGQEFIEAVLPKVARLRKMIDDAGLDIVLEVDGGVKPGTAKRVVEAGADMLVAGSAIFGAVDYGRAIEALRGDAS